MVVPAFLKKAKNYAKKSTCKNYRVGAVIAKKSYILAQGRNRPLPHNLRGKHGYDKGVHAEWDAVLKHRGNLKGSTIYVVVLNPNSNEVVSRPCDKCWELLKKHGVAQVVYSFRGETRVEIIS